MAYIGPLPAETFTSFATQEFSTSATTSYTLDHPVTNENELALFINNVRQQPGSGKAYTASGTALTLSAATASTDTMYAVFLGRALQTVNPADASVGTSQLAATSVTAAKLNNDIISGTTALAETPADTDELLLSDGGTLKRIDFSHIKSSPHKTLLLTTTISTDTNSVVINNSYITSTYRDYFLTLSNVHSSADNESVNLHFSTDNGSSYTTGSFHRASLGINGVSSSVVKDASTAGDALRISGNQNLGTGTGESINANLTLFNLLGTDNFKGVIGESAGMDQSAQGYSLHVGGVHDSTSAVNAIKIQMSSGNFNAGLFKFYGIT